MSRAGIVMVLVGGALLLWALSVAWVYWDASRRRLSEVRRTLWVAAAALLPGAGFLAYLFISILNAFLKPSSTEQGMKWVTHVKRPVDAPGKGSTIPATDLLDRPPAVRPASAAANPAPAYGGAYAPGVGGALSLAIVDGPDRGKSFSLHSLPLIIGRGAEAGIALDGDTGVSRRHAELYLQGAAVHIRDLRSTHGTYVNGRRIQVVSLTPGDRVTIGQSHLLVR